MSIFSKIQKIENLSPELKSLYLHKVMRDIAVGMISMFSVIFIFTLGKSLEFVFWYYFAICFLFFLFLPLWAKIIRYFSMHKLMAFGNLFYILYVLSLYLLAQKQFPLMTLIVFAVFFNILARATYWVPYNINLANFIDKHHRGRQLSFLNIVISLIGIVIPIFSAFIIAKFDFSVLYIISIAIFFVSFFPIFFIPKTREKYSFGYFETFKKIFSKKHLHTNLSYFADGFQDHIGSIMWPIFIFLILKGDFLNVGIVSAAVVLAVCILRYFIGEAVDLLNKKKMLKIGSFLHSIGWIFKTIASTGLHVFFIGVYHDFTRILFQTPLDVLTFEIAADEGHYIDEFTVMREMALNLGRAVVLLIGIILLQFINLQWLFLLGVAITLLTALISKDEFFSANRHLERL